jgi:hypothetical protein
VPPPPPSRAPTADTRRLITPKRRRPVAALALGSVLAAGGLAVGLALTGAFGGSDTGARTSHGAAPIPEDGTLLRVRGGERIYVVKAGARFPVPRSELAGFGYSPGRVEPVSAARLGQIPTVPADGKLVRSFASTVKWVVRGGKRELAAAPAGADVAVMPTTGLRQIPLPLYHRKTKIALVAAPVVIDKRFFHIFMKVTSPSGKPAGACVVYRELNGHSQERSNTAVQSGLCTARIRVSGAGKVQYVLRFIGAPGWRSSSASTGPIAVIPNPGA